MARTQHLGRISKKCREVLGLGIGTSAVLKICLGRLNHRVRVLKKTDNIRRILEKKGGPKIEYKYIVLQSTYKNGVAKRISFGIAGIEEYDGTITVLDSVSDISSEIDPVEELVDLCNDQQLSLIHFRDIVSDFLAVI